MSVTRRRQALVFGIQLVKTSFHATSCFGMRVMHHVEHLQQWLPRPVHAGGARKRKRMEVVAVARKRASAQALRLAQAESRCLQQQMPPSLDADAAAAPGARRHRAGAAPGAAPPGATPHRRAATADAAQRRLPGRQGTLTTKPCSPMHQSRNDVSLDMIALLPLGDGPCSHRTGTAARVPEPPEDSPAVANDVSPHIHMDSGSCSKTYEIAVPAARQSPGPEQHSNFSHAGSANPPIQDGNITWRHLSVTARHCPETVYDATCPSLQGHSAARLSRNSHSAPQTPLASGQGIDACVARREELSSSKPLLRVPSLDLHILKMLCNECPGSPQSTRPQKPICPPTGADFKKDLHTGGKSDQPAALQVASQSAVEDHRMEDDADLCEMDILKILS
eukprot:364558-Chlamydomonas_euryale.AAC.6